MADQIVRPVRVHRCHYLFLSESYRLRLYSARALLDHRRRRPGLPAACLQRGFVGPHFQPQPRCPLFYPHGRKPRSLGVAAHPRAARQTCEEKAFIARSWGWGADAISIQVVMTHAVDEVGRRPWPPPIGMAASWTTITAPQAAVSISARAFAPCWREMLWLLVFC